MLERAVPWCPEVVLSLLWRADDNEAQRCVAR